jgi:lipopolysaccharide export system protein LptC
MTEKNHQARIERLSRRNQEPRSTARSSWFIKAMRLVLPLAAAGIVAALFTMNGTEQARVMPVDPLAHQDLPKEIVQNELLNPKFESRDKQNRPYEIVAARAVQGKTNKDLVMLEKPVGTMTLGGGRVLKITSASGAYRQDTERFFLEGGVLLENSEGYSIQSEEAHMDLKERLTWSEKPVFGQGPDMQINAAGLKANAGTGEVVFTGPARLVLKKGFEGFQ